jgi:nicotinate-nucleotide adenylyltransferase
MMSNNQDKINTLNANIGVFGGSFDPIHLGHIQSATHVANELSLTKILLIPAYVSPHKTTKSLAPQASAKQRSDMVNQVCLNNSLFCLDERELVRAGHSLTLDTLKELKLTYPTNTLYLIIGMDSLLNFDRWHGYRDILTLCHVVVNTRPNYSLEQLNPVLRALVKTHQEMNIASLQKSSAGKIYFTQPKLVNISSSEIRHRLKQQKKLPATPSTRNPRIY